MDAWRSGRRKIACATATLAGAFIACGGSGTVTGSGPDVSAPNASGDDGPGVNTAAGGEAGCVTTAPGSPCGGSSAGDAPATDTAIDTGIDGSTAAEDSGGDAPASCLWTLTFHVVPGTHTGYCEEPPCSQLDLVSVLGANGQALKIAELSNNPCAITDCSSCGPARGYNTCYCDGGPNPLPQGGVDLTWSGTIWTPAGTCSQQPLANNVACDEPGCARAGQYMAHVCARPDLVDASGCGSQASPVCVDVPFTYPSEGAVVVTLP